MTKEEQNNILKSAWERKIKEHHDMPSDIADTYSMWVRAKVKQGQQMISQVPAQDQKQEQEQQSGNKAAPTE